MALFQLGNYHLCSFLGVTPYTSNLWVNYFITEVTMGYVDLPGVIEGMGYKTMSRLVVKQNAPKHKQRFECFYITN